MIALKPRHDGAQRRSFSVHDLLRILDGGTLHPVVARRAGVLRIGGLTYDESRSALRSWLSDVLKDTLVYIDKLVDQVYRVYNPIVDVKAADKLRAVSRFMVAMGDLVLS